MTARVSRAAMGCWVMKITLQYDIAAPLEQVFSYLSDDELRQLWTAGLEDVTYPAGHRPAEPLGARFTQRIMEDGQLREYRGEITVWAPPRHLAMTLATREFTFLVTWDLLAFGTGTRLSYGAELVQAKLLWRLLAWLTQGLTRRSLKEQLTRLKLLVETIQVDLPA